MSWILASVSKSVQSHILHSKDVVIAWKTLHNRYARTNAARKFAVERSLRTLIQGELDVGDYFEKLTKLWEELDAISGIYDDCNEENDYLRCKRLDGEREEGKVIPFLMGLNEIHEQARSNILGMRKIPEMDVVFDMVSQNETQKNVTRIPFEERHAGD